MLQPSAASPAPSSLNREAAALPSAAAPAPSVTETVVRPEGLRHGRWEAKPWAFYGMAGVVVFLGLVYALFRLRIIRLGRRQS